MYRGSRIALVIPAYREEKLIQTTLTRVPSLVDCIIVVDDASPDNQCEIIRKCAQSDSRIGLLKHSKNQGPGAAIVTGYFEASKNHCDIAVVIGGDNQMDLTEIANFLDPIIDGEVDYTKGNRFLLNKVEETLKRMPRLRLLANWLITAMTKMACGFYNIMDVVDGYTAISKRAIDTINWNNAWPTYGYPMDFLVRLNAYGFRVKDISRTAIYLPGERQSQINGLQYALKVSPMLVRAFFWRLRFKYIYLNFHPLVFFYYLGLSLIPLGLIFGGLLIIDRIFFGGYQVTASRAVLVALALISGTQFLLFAMLFDHEESRNGSFRKGTLPNKDDLKEKTAA